MALGQIPIVVRGVPFLEAPLVSSAGTPPVLFARDITAGQVIVFFLLIIGINVLFGFWAKSRGDDMGIHPGLSFSAGFFLGWFGVLIVPILRADRVINMPSKRPPPPMQPPAGAWQPPPRGQPGAYPPPPPQGPQGTYAPPPSHPQGPMLTGQPPAQQPPAPPQQQPQQMLVADEQGYVQCPACGARTKGTRKACMTCGVFLPPMYDPKAGG